MVRLLPARPEEEDPGSIPSAYLAALNCLELGVLGDRMHSSGFHGHQADTWCTNTHTHEVKFYFYFVLLRAFNHSFQKAEAGRSP